MIIPSDMMSVYNMYSTLSLRECKVKKDREGRGRET